MPIPLKRPSLTWRSACGSYTVVVAPPCLDDMLRLARNQLPNEIGTSLVGHYSRDRFRAFVTGLAPLSADSRGTPTSFHRGTRGLKAFFRALFQRFQGSRHYVGEWHSHPNGTAIPSGVDDRNQLAIAQDLQTDCPECILIVFAGDLLKAPELGVYVYSRMRGKIILKGDRNPPLSLSTPPFQGV